jgi:acyl-CoA thioesterase-1
MFPDVGESSPAIKPKSVDFPLPLAPVMAMNSPLLILKETSLRIVIFSVQERTFLVTLFNSIIIGQMSCKTVKINNNNLNKTMKINLYAIILILVSIIPACQQQNEKVIETIPKPTQQISNKPKILAFGDSLTAGFGLQEKESFPYLLQEKIKSEGYDYEVINAGVSGDTTRGGMERIDWSLEQDGVQIMILELGGNDLLRGMSPQQMKLNLDEIIRRTKAKKVKILLCGLFPPQNASNEFQKEFSQVFPKLAKEHNLAFMPFFLEDVGGKKELNQPDGIHPNAEGSKIITENVYKNLKPLLSL